MTTRLESFTELIQVVSGRRGRMKELPENRHTSWLTLTKSVRKKPRWPPTTNLPEWPQQLGGHASLGRWFLLTCGLGILSVATPLLIFPVGMGQIGSLFFQIAFLSSFITPLFWRYGVELFIEKRSPWRCDYQLALRLATIFTGLALIAALPVIVLGDQGYQYYFLDSANIISPTSSNFSFYSLLPLHTIITTNLSVLATYFLIGLCFRQLGSLIVLNYTALTWGVALAAAFMTTVAIHPAWLIIAPIALIPHLVLEVTGFCLAAVAGATCNWTIRTTEWRSPLQSWALRRVLVMLILASLCVPLAAWLETSWAVAVIEFAPPPIAEPIVK